MQLSANKKKKKKLLENFSKKKIYTRAVYPGTGILENLERNAAPNAAPKKWLFLLF